MNQSIISKNAMNLFSPMTPTPSPDHWATRHFISEVAEGFEKLGALNLVHIQVRVVVEAGTSETKTETETWVAETKTETEAI